MLNEAAVNIEVSIRINIMTVKQSCVIELRGLEIDLHQSVLEGQEVLSMLLNSKARIGFRSDGMMDLKKGVKGEQ